MFSGGFDASKKSNDNADICIRICRYFFYFGHTTFGLFILRAPNGYYYQTMFSGVFYGRVGEINASFQARIFE